MDATQTGILLDVLGITIIVAAVAYVHMANWPQIAKSFSIVLGAGLATAIASDIYARMRG